MARKRQRTERCGNCDTALPNGTNYCPSCGQENHTHKLPVRHFVVEWLAGMFNFDTKLLHTLRDLFWPPGKVIREFNANKRVRYVHPLRIYLFTSLLFFLYLAASTAKLNEDAGPVVVVGNSEPQEANGLQLQLDNGSTIADSALVALSARSSLTNTVLDSTLQANGAPPTLLNRTFMRLALNLSGNSLRKEAFVQQLFTSFSKVLFVLVPLFAAFLMALFWRTARFYTEHLVFALYFHTALFLLLGCTLIINRWTDSTVAANLMPLIIPLQLVLSVRTVHGRSWWSSTWRALLILLIYVLLVGLGIAAAAIISSL
jgi:hypothetical protein